MLQVARLAPQQLGESRDLVVAFLNSRLNSDGGFQDRTGASDLYYSVFGLEGLIALQEPVPVEPVASFLKQFGDGEGLDLVHLCCLARCWANISRDLDRVPTRNILDRIEANRSPDGGYGTVYAAFLALGAYQDFRVPVPDSRGLLEAINTFRARGGGYSNRPGDEHGITTVTAAAVRVLKTFDAPIDGHLAVWLLDRCHPSGGFLATGGAPVPDLLSTATALHALAGLHAPLAGLQDACLDFVDSLWTNRGGFYGSWMDDSLDCEYTYYGLLALGHLT
jgi:prenyltransferase beta subunit